MENEITAKVLRRKKLTLLLERVVEGRPFRVVVPESVVIYDNGSTVSLSEENFEMGIEYGVPWEDLLSNHEISAYEVADFLRKNGLWTVEDIIANPSSVQSAVLSASRSILADVLQIAKSLSRNKET